MTPANHAGSDDQLPRSSPRPSRLQDEADLSDTLNHCSAATRAAAGRFRQAGGTEHLPAIISGIIERFVEPEFRGKLANPNDQLRMSEDLGIDSLTMMEIVMLTEDVFQISINNDEAHRLRTVGNFMPFIERKLAQRVPAGNRDASAGEPGAGKPGIVIQLMPRDAASAH